MKNYPKRYIPQNLDNWLKTHTHVHIKWNKDLTSDIISLDYDGLVITTDTILRVAGSRDLDKNNLCEIQSTMFKKILNNSYSIYLDYLIENKIILTDNFYIRGEKSVSYKLNEHFTESLVSIKIENKLFNKRTLNAVKSTSKLKVSKAHINNFKSSFKIDYDKASEWVIQRYINGEPDHKGRILNPYTKTLLQHKLLQINDDQIWISRSDTNGRINSNLTTLNGDMKQFIVGYDYSIDIKNCQPLILCLLIDYVKGIKGHLDNSSAFSAAHNLSLTCLSSYESKILSKNLSNIELVRFIDDLKSLNLPTESELKKWRNLCQKGELYEYFQREIFNQLGRKLNRQEVKDLIIVNMYSSNHTNNEYKKLFEFIFPTIYKFIKNIKSLLSEKRKHRILPIMLQGIESYMMVEKILPKLDEINIKYLFIHDGFIVKKQDVDRVELIILQEFNYLRLTPTLSVDKLKN
jgi:hypothetical protein